MQSSRVFGVLCTAMAVLFSSAIAQVISPVIPFQGILTDQSGSPVQASSSVQLIFRLYDTPTGGSAKWEETQKNVALVQGHFSVLLGARTPFPNLDLFSQPLFLGITVDDGDPTTVDIEMRPRQALVPVINAFHANNADKLAGHNWSDLLEGGVNDPSAAKIRSDKLNIAFDGQVFDQSSSQLRIKSAAIGEALLAPSAVTNDKIADQTISPNKLKPRLMVLSQTSPSWTAEVVATSAGGWVDVPGLAVKITASNRPIMVFLSAATPTDSNPEHAPPAHLYVSSGVPGPLMNAWDIAVFRTSARPGPALPAVLLSAFELESPVGPNGGSGLLMLPPACTTVDPFPTGLVIYSIKVRYRGSTPASNNTSIKFEGISLYAIEL